VAGGDTRKEGASLCDGVESLGEWHPDASGKSRVNGKNEGTLYATVVFSAPGTHRTVGLCQIGSVMGQADEPSASSD
jgi:hypothetical protein